MVSSRRKSITSTATQGTTWKTTSVVFVSRAIAHAQRATRVDGVMAGKGARHRLGMSQSEYAEKLERILSGLEDDGERDRVEGSTSTPTCLKKQTKGSGVPPGVDL